MIKKGIILAGGSTGEEFSTEIFFSEFCFSRDRLSSDSIFQKLQLSFRV